MYNDYSIKLHILNIAAILEMSGEKFTANRNYSFLSSLLVEKF